MVKNLYAAALVLTSASLVSVSAQAQNGASTRTGAERTTRTAAPTLPGRQCASMEVLEAQKAADPTLALRLEKIEAQTRQAIASGRFKTTFTSTGAVITIPVVVHVLYNTAAQNISDAQVQSQIAVLNEDFRNLNADRTKTPAAFAGLASDIGIQFKLATRTPTGAATNGIIHKQTKTASWSSNDAVKNSKRGGDDAWDATKYLNIWACNLGQGLLGYAQFPGGAPATDGVVILYSAFGSRAKAAGTYTSTYDLGRTATHEVGHWLNLRHIWGDASCGNDLVSDTPTQQGANYGCPSYPKVTCGNQGDMSMNYMDYTDDACMYMFSSGQSARMNALFASGGARASLLSSTAASVARTSTKTSNSVVGVYPNPAADVLNLTNLDAPANAKVRVYSLQGAEMRQARYDGQGRLQVQSLPRGLYYVDVTDGNGNTSHQRFEKQ